MRKRDGGARLAVAAALLAAALTGCSSKDEDEDRAKRDESPGYLQALANAKTLAERQICQARLKAVHTTLQLHLLTKDAFPASLEELAETGSPATRCPSGRQAAYQYVPGQDSSMPRDNVLAYEAQGVHGGKCNVLRLDGTIVSMTPEELEGALAETTKGIAQGGS